MKCQGNLKHDARLVTLDAIQNGCNNKEHLRAKVLQQNPAAGSTSMIGLLCHTHRAQRVHDVQLPSLEQKTHEFFQLFVEIMKRLRAESSNHGSVTHIKMWSGTCTHYRDSAKRDFLQSKKIRMIKGTGQKKLRAVNTGSQYCDKQP